ncbi:hypothetical protein GUITHDRAFT_109490 [Guillardia theta CCMP2712]|uniref:Uncharacterized protein n=1 Tax=Guillardia theta (strain CCMP2712) TaxID=905079 RepID=L1J8Q5_GUITC|nr:hypothetical protein GUITHDRAFT_109490 [Guillardia theta CCMP2712]EKX44712.1 hypothetical protein GUITHDRAFT_109490 [Guillardia theta CCMP2712]|eukprot:XP_005831692.1 hypothetical protein GUITHDRAFT_109490 [Guillardia theta CCMP2712]
MSGQERNVSAMHEGEGDARGKPRMRAYVWWYKRALQTLRSSSGVASSAFTSVVALTASVLVAIFLYAKPAILSNGLLSNSSDAYIGQVASSAQCRRFVNLTEHVDSMLLAAHFLLYSQRDVQEDEVEQSNVLLTLSQFYREVRRRPDKFPVGLQTRIHEAFLHSFSFWEAHSRSTKSGVRYIIYPRAQIGRLETLSQVILSLLHFHRSLDAGALPRGVGLNAPSFAQTSQGWRVKRALDDYSEYFLRLRLSSGRFVRTLEGNGRPRKQHKLKMHEASSEGAALLAMISLAKYYRRGDLWHKIGESTRAMLDAYAASSDVEEDGKRSDLRDFYEHGALALMEIADSIDPVGGQRAEGDLPEVAARGLLEMSIKIASSLSGEGGGKKQSEDQENWSRIPSILLLLIIIITTTTTTTTIIIIIIIINNNNKNNININININNHVHNDQRLAPGLAAAARLAAVKSRGGEEDLEAELTLQFLCLTRRMLTAMSKLQVGGLLADPASAQSTKNKMMRGLRGAPSFNLTKCIGHVQKNLVGSIKGKKEKMKKERDEKEMARAKARLIEVKPGEPISIAEMIQRSKNLSNEQEEQTLTECDRAMHAHQRCTNDNPVGKQGFMACCRQLSGYLFSCVEDYNNLPNHLRTLYVPSYTHYCVPDGHSPLPKGFGQQDHPPRESEFEHRKVRAELDSCDLAAMGGIPSEGGGLRVDHGPAVSGRRLSKSGQAGGACEGSAKSCARRCACGHAGAARAAEHGVTHA